MRNIAYSVVIWCRCFTVIMSFWQKGGRIWKYLCNSNGSLCYFLLSSVVSILNLLETKYSHTLRYIFDVYYTKKHEWIKVNGDVGIVGISKYAEQKLGDIVYVELPTIGDKINVDDQCAVVESVKAVSEVYSPVSGTVIEVNPDVEKNTKIINQSPLDEGWLFKLRLSDLSQVKDLLSEENYDKFLTSES
ncbi:unnamed protein product [Schistosoma spindalis]|nr:unnamed protein product [Schistosoma spindale]